MGSFDISKAAAIITTSPNPILDVLGVSFGVPACLLDMAKTVMNSFPSSTLNGFMAGIQAGKDKADSVVKEITRKIFLDTGIIEYDSNLGRFVWVGSSSNQGVEANGSALMDGLFGLGKILGIGAQAWLIGETLMGQIDTIKNCIDQLGSFEALQKGNSGVADKYVGFTAKDPITGEEIPFEPPPPPAEAASLVYAANKAQLEVAVGFSRKCDQKIKEIAEIQLGRINNPDAFPEPVFNGDIVDRQGVRLSDILSGTDFRYEVDLELDSSGRPILPPDSSFNPFAEIITLSGLQPPLAKKGQFFFSRTGMYYDAYGGGITFPDNDIASIVSAVYFDEDGVPYAGGGVPANSMKYMFEYNPNIGGKGQTVSLKTYNQWANSVFDLDNIDESEDMNIYYSADHLLQVLIDQRNRQVYDVSSSLNTMVKSGDYTVDSAFYINEKQRLYSMVSTHNKKINKRKKQIQAIVVLSPDNRTPRPGNIPINDFSVLADTKITIEKTKQDLVMFHPGDVSGVVLPLNPYFVKSELPDSAFLVNDLMVGNVGAGALITHASGVSGTEPTMLALNDHITTEGLVAVYNFLDADIVKPDSDKYLSINCSVSSANIKPAQLVASSVESVFPSGIGMPYFRGICNFFSGSDGNIKAEKYPTNDEYLYSPYRPYGYARIESGWDDIDSLLYKEKGFSFETWVHVPDLGVANGEGWASDKSLSSLHRVMLGCENRGGTASTTDADLVVGPLTPAESVQGLLVGFTRDRRLTQGGAPSNNPVDNSIDDGLAFYMAPTQSINTSAVTFLNVSANDLFCEQDRINTSDKYYCISVDSSTSVGGQTFNDCSTAYKLATVTISYGEDKVSIYLNGVLMKEQSIADTFGGLDANPAAPRIPSIIDTSSFSYKNTYEESLPWVPPRFPGGGIGQQDFWYWDGPIANNARVPITPWIIGGGYTDGMTAADLDTHVAGSNDGMNFMGGKFGGKKSGLHGFLGSVKLYNRALNIGEVLKNYTSQKGFFENIQL